MITTEKLNGNCPIQAEGITSCGKPWYFRARDGVSLTVGTGKGHPLESTLWAIDDEHPAGPKFESADYPGWASHEACEAWIGRALMCFEAWKVFTSGTKQPGVWVTPPEIIERLKTTSGTKQNG